MKTELVIRILKEYNTWRLGLEPYDEAGASLDYNPKEITEAIESAISILEQ
jgi:hypothetical protein